MKVLIKTVKGEILEVPCSPETTVAFLKERVVDKFKFEIDTQKLIFRGKHLDDQKTLGELEIKDGDAIILMIIKVHSTENSPKAEGRTSTSQSCPARPSCSNQQQPISSTYLSSISPCSTQPSTSRRAVGSKQ